MRRSPTLLSALTAIVAPSESTSTLVAAAVAPFPDEASAALRLAELESWLVDKLARVIHVGLLKHLFEAELIELGAERVRMLVGDMLLHELSSLELLVADHALIDGVLLDHLGLLLRILLLHLLKDGVLLGRNDLSDAAIDALFRSLEVFIFEFLVHQEGRSVHLTSRNPVAVSEMLRTTLGR